MGTVVRCVRGAGDSAGAAHSAGAGRSSTVVEGAKTSAEGARSRSSEAAQQLSAWPCVVVAGLSGAAWRIGQASRPAQHAIGASREGIQPAHSAGWPDASATSRTATETRPPNLSTSTRMREAAKPVNGMCLGHARRQSRPLPTFVPRAPPTLIKRLRGTRIASLAAGLERGPHPARRAERNMHARDRWRLR